MFDDAGGKIKSWAEIICVVGIILSIIGGIIIIVIGAQYNPYSNTNPLFLSGILVMVVGSLSSWCSGLLLFTFGDIAQNTASLNTKADTIISLYQSQLTGQANRQNLENKQNASRSVNTDSDSIHVPATTPELPKSAGNPPSSITRVDLSKQTGGVFVPKGVASITCPKCGTSQLGNRHHCWYCRVPFIKVEEGDLFAPNQNMQDTVNNAHVDESVYLDLRKLTVTCPLCGKSQPSNRKTCEVCGAKFYEIPSH